MGNNPSASGSRNQAYQNGVLDESLSRSIDQNAQNMNQIFEEGNNGPIAHSQTLRNNKQRQTLINAKAGINSKSTKTKDINAFAGPVQSSVFSKTDPVLTKKKSYNSKISGIGQFLLSRVDKDTPHSQQSSIGLSKVSSTGTQGGLQNAITNALMKKYNFKLSHTDLRTPLLVEILKGELKCIRVEMKQLYDNLEQQDFQFEMSVGFWLALHLEQVELCNYLTSKVPMLKKVVGSILKKKQETRLISQISRANSRVQSRKSWKGNNEEEKKAKRNSDKDKDEELYGLPMNKSKMMQDGEDQGDSFDYSPDREDENMPSKNITKIFSSLKKPTSQVSKRVKADKPQDPSSSDLNNLVPSEIQVNTEAADSLFSSFESISQLIEVKNILKQEFPTFMGNLLRIILDKDEEILAQIIVAYYKCSIDQELLVKAIKNDRFSFLYYMFGFGKNFLYDQVERKSVQITFTMLLKYIREYKTDDDEFKEAVKDICDWKLMHSGGNFLEALLAFEMDDLAIQYMGSFGNNLNEGLLIYCLESENQKFIRNALKLKAFDKMLFREEAVVLKMLTFLNEGTRTNYILDLMSLIDISILKNRQIKELMMIFTDFAEQNYEKNKLILSYNPILTIVLACETLKKIAQVRKKFENEAKRLSNSLQRLGEMFISKITDEKYYERLIMDRDGMDRPVLKIICENSFEKLMDEKDPKAENMMHKLWKGNEATNCDGNIFGYSRLSTAVFKDFRRNSSNNKFGSIIELASNLFEANYKVDYMVQHRYRSKSISFFYMKEFFCSLIMLIIFQVINYQYLAEIALANSYKESTVIVLVEEIINGTATGNFIETSVYSDNRDDLQLELGELQGPGSLISSLGNFSYLFCFGLMFHIALKLIFNMYSTKTVPLDKWSIMDGISAILNLAAVQVIKNVTVENMLDPFIKDSLDYFMIVVLAFSWIRFFMYFLVIRQISKLLLTLIEMVEDTIAFIFIVACFITIMSSIFTTLYQDINGEKFGSLTTTVRTLFDAALAVYDYDDMGGRTLSYSILIIFHVFFSNVLLLNYLIAILSTTYDNMKQSGIFKYKKNLFQYCERFITSFNDEAYGELVLHPPPLSYGCVLLLPFVRNRAKMLRVTKTFSLIMFWVENSFLLAGFFVYELILVPFAYLRTLTNIILHVEAGVLRKIFLILYWLIIGIIIDTSLIYKDMKCLIHVLCHKDGFENGYIHQLQDESLNINTKIEILNLARDGVIILFKTLKNHFKSETGNERGFRRRHMRNKKPSNSKRESNMEYEDKASENQSSVGKQRQSKVLNSKQKSDEQLSQTSFDYSDESDVENFNIEDELQFLEDHAGYNPNDQNCLYVVKKSAIIEDWRVRRKVMIEEKIQHNNAPHTIDPTIAKETPKSKHEINQDMKSIKNQRAKSVLVPNEENKFINERSGKYEDVDDQIKKGFQSKINPKLVQGRKSKIVLLDNLIASQRVINGEQKGRGDKSKLFTSAKTQNLDRSASGAAIDYDLDLKPIELKCITNFFNSFVIISEQQLHEHLDIVLFLRALPERITPENVHKVILFNFRTCQESLIAFQNLDLVNAFEYFDDKNRERVQTVKEKLSLQKSNLESVRDIVKFVKRKMFNSEGLFRVPNEEEKSYNVSSNHNSPQKRNGSFSSRFPLNQQQKRTSTKSVNQNFRMLNGFNAGSSNPAATINVARFSPNFMRGNGGENIQQMANNINAQQEQLASSPLPRPRVKPVLSQIEERSQQYEFN